MPHIWLAENTPGPRGPMLFRSDVIPPLSGLAQILMRGSSTLTLAERELIGTCVSRQNDCRYCQTIHGAVAAHHLGATRELQDLVWPPGLQAIRTSTFHRERAAAIAEHGYSGSSSPHPRKDLHASYRA